MLTDFRGTEIKVGSLIVYSVKASTSCYVREGTVTAITEKPHPWSTGQTVTTLSVAPTGRCSSNWRKGTKPVAISNLENVVVLG